MYIDTFWANLLVIWVMTIVLMITLYFDVLRKVIDWFGRLPERFLKNNQ